MNAHDHFTTARKISRDITSRKLDWSAKNWASVARHCAIATDKLRASVNGAPFTRMELNQLTYIADLNWDARAQIETLVRQLEERA